jgi:hypothetical protein
LKAIKQPRWNGREETEKKPKTSNRKEINKVSFFHCILLIIVVSFLKAHSRAGLSTCGIREVSKASLIILP